MNDLELLRRHEPIVRLTRGELFFPCAVDAYVRGCSLWMRDESGRTREIVPRGALDLETLAARSEAPAGSSLHLRFVDEPLTAIDLQRWLQQPGRESFRVPGRLARVPFPSRLVDSGFNLSLLVRGKVPGGTAAAAEVAWRACTAGDDRFVYYGRVVREGGWIALHYLFFYPMNNWRSGFHGVNDHEADWEQIFVYLYERGDGAAPEPYWVAYASHDYRGDDLRRRWDDPLLCKEGAHPVVFVGAGSHASYFEPGEYVMGVEPRFLAPVRRVITQARQFWSVALGQGLAVTNEASASNPLSIPFVDYARGDGVSLGPGEVRQWTPVLISDAVPWVDRYRGLWGLDTRDPFGGERAPSGPKHNRDGSVRLSWSDPLGWAGLEKVLPPPEVPPELEARQAELDTEIATLKQAIQEQRQLVRKLAVDVTALGATEYHSALHTRKAQDLVAREGDLRGLQSAQVEAMETRAAIRAYAERIRAGDAGDPQTHLQHVHHPAPPIPSQRRIVQLWGALSGAIALLALVAMIAFALPHWWLWVICIVLAFMAVEAAMRGRIANFLLNTVIALAVFAALILVWEFWRALLILGLIAIAIYILRENLRELAKS